MAGKITILSGNPTITPLAPNITATVTVAYSLVGNGSVYVIGGTITLPTDITHLKKIDIVASLEP